MIRKNYDDDDSGKYPLKYFCLKINVINEKQKPNSRLEFSLIYLVECKMIVFTPFCRDPDGRLVMHITKCGHDFKMTWSILV